jgi:hypothetical protein
MNNEVRKIKSDNSNTLDDRDINQQTHIDAISFSEKIYALNWHKHFPLQLTENEDVRIVSFSDAFNFIKENHTNIFAEDLWGNPFFNEDNPTAKKRYYEEMSDCFLFFKEQKPYAVIIGTVCDWSTYYLRYGAFLKDFQGGGRVQTFLNHIILVLQNNSVIRVETDIAPSNLINLHIFNKLQFNMTGLNISDRWGALIHMTKFLNAKAEQIFLDQFCVGIRPQLDRGLAEVIPINRTKERGNL